MFFSSLRQKLRLNDKKLLLKFLIVSFRAKLANLEGLSLINIITATIMHLIIKLHTKEVF